MKDNKMAGYVLVVDDMLDNLFILTQFLLDHGYSVRTAKTGGEAVAIVSANPPDLVLLDINLPDMSGFEVCRHLKAVEASRDIPVIFLSGLDNTSDKVKGFEAGGVDYITKPFKIEELLARVQTHVEMRQMHIRLEHEVRERKRAEEALKKSNEELEQRVVERTRDLLIAQDATISSMAILAEFRDPETGAHIQRTKLYVKLLLEKLSLCITLLPEAIELIWRSAPLHDIGKVAIPDGILFKPEKLTDAEFEQMKKHTTLGYETIRKAELILGKNSFLNFAKEITWSHHEKWDGTGYPQGLKGEEIPMTARIMALADVYDALVSERPYKQVFPHKKAMEIIHSGSGIHFEPLLVKIFMEHHEDFDKIARQYKDVL